MAPQFDLEHFRLRVLQDALAEATSGYWLRRADTFTAVGSPDCDAIALACRRHAHLIHHEGLTEQTLRDLATLLEETEEVR